MWSSFGSPYSAYHKNPLVARQKQGYFFHRDSSDLRSRRCTLAQWKLEIQWHSVTTLSSFDGSWGGSLFGGVPNVPKPPVFLCIFQSRFLSFVFFFWSFSELLSILSMNSFSASVNQNSVWERGRSTEYVEVWIRKMMFEDEWSRPKNNDNSCQLLKRLIIDLLNKYGRD